MADRQLPFGQLPLLQIDGIDIVQSQAAVRYLARRANLYGKSAFDEVKCDMIAETIRGQRKSKLNATLNRKTDFCRYGQPCWWGPIQAK